MPSPFDDITTPVLLCDAEGRGHALATGPEAGESRFCICRANAGENARRSSISRWKTPFQRDFRLPVGHVFLPARRLAASVWFCCVGCVRVP